MILTYEHPLYRVLLVASSSELICPLRVVCGSCAVNQMVRTCTTIAHAAQAEKKARQKAKEAERKAGNEERKKEKEAAAKAAMEKEIAQAAAEAAALAAKYVLLILDLCLA